MASKQAAKEALEASSRSAQRLVADVGQRQTRILLERAQRDLQKRLDAALHRGLDEDSFTVVQLRVALEQVRAVLVPLTAGIRGVLVNNAAQAAERAASNAIAYLQKAEREFRGVSQPLALDEARMLSAASKGANASVLRRLASGPPGDPRRLGILQRYGVETVGHFERILQVGMIAKKSVKEMREDLTEASPFLKAAPAHWAQRIVRTETMAAYNKGNAESIKNANEQLGDMVKIISCVFDDRTGADSFAVHGEIRRPEEMFETWYGPVEHPPDRPNDRATVTPHRLSWPIPPYLQWVDWDRVVARWQAEGRKGAPPDRPLMTTVPLHQFPGAGG
jgi:hypothetical protein